MSQTSPLFLLYFLPLAVAGYYVLSFSQKAQNVWLLLACLVFFGWGNPVYLWLLALMVFLNYVLAFQADRARVKRISTRWIWVSLLLVNIGPLFVYRYLEPLADSVNDWFGWAPITGFPAMPLGIMFLALRGISYVVDIYRQKAPLERNLLHCALYISFFPALMAGPILLYQDMAAQIRSRKADWQGFSDGLIRFLFGLARVVLLGQGLAAVAQAVFNTSNISGIFTSLPVSTALIGLIAFILQLYHQLCGYSDMALGLARIFGFTLPENFNAPVLATSVKDFWDRAYISLSAWFNEYIYARLSKRSGANRDLDVRNSFLMWMLMGLWIAPGLPSLIFALWNFLLLLVEQLVEFESGRLRIGWRRLYVVVGMVLGFSALGTDTIYEFALFIGNLFGAGGSFWGNMSAMLLREFWPVLLLGVVFLFPLGAQLHQSRLAHGAVGAVCRVLYPVMVLTMVVLVFAFVVRGGYNPTLAAEYNLWSVYYG